MAGQNTDNLEKNVNAPSEAEPAPGRGAGLQRTFQPRSTRVQQLQLQQLSEQKQAMRHQVMQDVTAHCSGDALRR